MYSEVIRDVLLGAAKILSKYILYTTHVFRGVSLVFLLPLLPH